MTTTKFESVEQFEQRMRNDLGRFAGDFLQKVDNHPLVGAKDIEFTAYRIFTHKNCYNINVHIHIDGSKSPSLLASATCRTPRAGENWTRGNDLADGPFTEETWLRILADIVSYELVKIHRHKTVPLPDSANVGMEDTEQPA